MLRKRYQKLRNIHFKERIQTTKEEVSLGGGTYKGRKLTHGVLQGIEPVYSDFKYRDNMALLRGKKPENKGLRGKGTSLAYAGGFLASKVVPVASLPLYATSLINSNRQDREVQIEAIKLANKLNKKLGK